MSEMDIVEIRDPAGESRARVLTSLGFNCFDFRTTVGGESFPVLWAAEEFAGGGERPSGSGIPLLFPFPGRIAGAEWSWRGRRYSLEPADGRGNAIHGFAYNRPWRVVERAADRVSGEFQARRDAPEVLEQWPADFLIRVHYRLQGGRLRGDVTVQNTDEQSELPCGFGAHPYFRLPGPSADACRVRLPVSEQWELEAMIPTGRRQPLEEARQLQRGVPFGELQLDNVFAGLQFTDDVCRSLIEAPDNGPTIELSFGRPFREMVVYTPPHRDALCIEPYSCVPGAIELGEQAGWIVLPPGASQRYWFEINSRPQK